MSRLRQRADRIKTQVSIASVLNRYGYQVRVDAAHRQQQFPCNLHGDGRDNKPSARVYPASNSWYCVGVSERVLTDLGWLRMDDIRRSLQGRYIGSFEYLGTCPDSCGPRTYGCRCCGERVTVSDGEILQRLGEAHQCPQSWRVLDESPLVVFDGVGAWENPQQYLRRGTQEVVRVQTRAGYSVVVTPEHEIEVVERGWVPARDLRPGEVLVVPKPTKPRFSRCFDLPLGDLNERVCARHPRLSLPARWSVELGECLGYVFGDGWVTPRADPASGVVGLTAHAGDVEDARRIFRFMQGWTSGQGSEVHRTDVTVVRGREYMQDQYVFTIGNDEFCEFFQRLGLDKKGAPNERGLPESIWRAPTSGVRGFLRGVYATDGSVFRPKGHQGIRVNLYSVSGAFLKDVQLLLLQFGIHSRVHPLSKTRAKGRLTHPCWYLQLATGIDVLTFRKRVGIANVRKQAVLNSYRYNPRGSRPFKPTVESVTPAGCIPVGDISMPVEHSFVAGGIKVHNCFACDKTRDPIETVREIEGLGFVEAIDLLEKQYGLPPMPFEDEYDAPAPTPKGPVCQGAVEIHDPDLTFAEAHKALRGVLVMLTEDRLLPMDTLLPFWEGVDQLAYMVEKQTLDEAQGLLAVIKLQQRLEEVREGGPR